MVMKLDDRMKNLMQDREELIVMLTRSHRMYSWVKGEDIGDLVDNFAVANPEATLGDLQEWTKRTYMARLTASKGGAGLEANIFHIPGKQAQTMPERFAQEVTQAPAGKNVDIIKDVVRATPRRAEPRTDLKKVAEPGNEPKEDPDEHDQQANISAEEMKHLTAGDQATDKKSPSPFDKLTKGEGGR